MSIVAYIICWILMITLVVGFVLVILFGTRSEKCRRDPNLYCYPDWKCQGSEDPNLYKTQIDSFKARCAANSDGSLPEDCDDPTFMNADGSVS